MSLKKTKGQPCLDLLLQFSVGLSAWDLISLVRYWRLEVVFHLERATDAPQLAEHLQGLGAVNILSLEAHVQRQEADRVLKETKKRQAEGVATGVQTAELTMRLLELRGLSGSQRKRGLV